MTSLQPLGNKIVIRRLEAPKQSPGGITLPDPAREAPKRGVVLAISSGYDVEKLGELELELEDEVLFGGYAGNEVEHEGEKLIILDGSEVLARVVR